jgi:hypothetical protein
MLRAIKSMQRYMCNALESIQTNRCTLRNLADSRVRRLLNHVEQPVAFDGHIKIWADGLSFANAFSYPRVQLRYVERKPESIHS